MDTKLILEKIKEARGNSKKRNFVQTFDCIVNLKNLDLRKPEHKIDLGVQIESFIKAKPLRIAAVIDHSITGAEDIFDKVIYKEDLEKYKGNIKEIRKLSKEADKFVVLATLMPTFAQIFGKYLGPQNKMPNPRLGMVIGPKVDLKALYDKLQRTVHLQTRKNLVLQFSFGSEAEKDEVLAENLKHVLDSLVHALPLEKNNIKDIFIKLTMGRLVRI